MEHYDLELSIVLDDHGYRQALALQAKTGKDKSKIIKNYLGGMTLVNSDGSVGIDQFTNDKKVRINFIGHGDSGSTIVADTAEARTWTPIKLAEELREVVEWALPARSKKMFQRLSMIVCYGGGHTYSTLNQYGHIINPADSFGYKFFYKASYWITDMTARGDISTTSMYRKAGTAANSLNPNDYTGGFKSVGEDNARKDRYRKVRFYRVGSQIQVEWPYLGYD